MDLRGKRLLILGGTYNIDDICSYAKEQGITLIATGNNPSHPLAKAADEYYYADIYNADHIADVVREHNIDGIFAGGNEDIIVNLFDVVKQTGLPFYATKEQWEVTGNKQLLKQKFSEAGLPVVPEYKVSTIPTDSELSEISYPVVVKPVDGSGSRGVYLCHNEAELLGNIPHSLQYSRSGKIIIEKFMTGHIIVFYVTAINGDYYVASMCDKYAPLGSKDSARMPTIAQVYLYPSRHLSDCIDWYFPSMKQFLRNLNIKDGVIGFQGFCDGTNIAFTEVGYRLGGTSQQNYTRVINNYSNMFLLMNYALTGKMTDEPCRENPYFPKICGTLQLISKGGIVGKEIGVEEVRNMPEVISFEKHYGVGDTIPQVDNVSRVHYRIFLVTDSIEHLKNTIVKIQQTLIVLDHHMEKMLEENFDISRLDRECTQAL